MSRELIQSHETRRIPITKGRGPFKRTVWVPVSEYHSRRTPEGTTKTSHWRVGMDWGYGGRGDRGYGGRRVPGGRLGYDEDDDVYWHPGYRGFRERGPGDLVWRWTPAAGCPPGRQPPLMPVHGWNPVWPWQPGIPWTDFDQLIAEDLQELEELRRTRHGANLERINNELNDINGRFANHLTAYTDAVSAPVSSERLTALRNEATYLADRRAEHEEQSRERDLVRAQELRDAARGRRLHQGPRPLLPPGSPPSMIFR